MYFFPILGIFPVGGLPGPVKGRWCPKHYTLPLSFSKTIPFVQNHSGNNSKTMFLCICICYETIIISKKNFICYAAPFELQRTQLSLHLLRKMNSKIIVAIWTNGTKPGGLVVAVDISESFSLSGPLRLRVQSRAEDAVENRGLYRVFVFALV